VTLHRTGSADSEAGVRVAVPLHAVRPGAVADDPFPGIVAEILPQLRTGKQLLQAVRQGPGVLRGRQQASHLVRDYLFERPYRADDHGTAARHGLYGLQRRDKLAYSVPGTGDDEDIEDGVILTDSRHWHPAGEDRVQAERGGLTLQRAAFGPVADDERAGTDAAVVKDLDRLEQGADALVRDQAGNQADDVLARPDAEVGPELPVVIGQRLEKLVADPVGDDHYLVGGNPTFGDLVAHRLAERHHQVRGPHAVRLQGAAEPVAIAAGQVGGARGGRVPGQPGVLPEAAYLIHDRQAGAVAQGQGDERVGVVARRVQQLRAEVSDQARRVPQVGLGDRVRPARHDRWQQPVVRDPGHGHQGPAVDLAGRDREADPRHNMRVQAAGALGERDLLGADRVPRAGRWQRVGDDVQHSASPGGRPPGDPPRMGGCAPPIPPR